MRTYVAGCDGQPIQVLAQVKAYVATNKQVGGSNNDMLAYAVTSSPDLTVAFGSTGYPHVLLSYAYDEDNSFFADKLGYVPADWLGDSGAFTAWTLGKTIDIDGLVAWAHSHVERNPSFLCINLDVIPGKKGETPTDAEQRKAVQESLVNADYLRDAGLKIMEVFHFGEPVEQLGELIERRRPGEVIGIGGLVGRHSAEKNRFCDAAFAYARDRCGWQALPPLHGLGVTPTSSTGGRYPWYSVDSSSWLAPGLYGRHVSRAGVVGRSDKRTSNRSVRQIYLIRVLEGWLRREQELTALWARRGVRHADHPVPV